ncbi:7-deoxyloganetic acid glucosyltransferase-like [Bidens hawaiensis]|uniref:7-deoxyloganetic acid glucosyltransferase-like n=1 Tax=Bidens hawaiensis TaxID=980011 RepID=UPI0040497A7C
MDQTLKTLPHVLIFPLPFQGPVNCALKLAELLCLFGIHVTFLNTEHMHRLLLRHTDVMSRFNGYPDFKFQTVPDGVEHETPVHRDQFMEVMASVDKVTKPLFREMIVSGELSRKSEWPVTVMIPDASFPFAVDIAIEASIPVICFDTLSPCCVWTSYLNLPTLIEAGDVPFKGNDLDQLITSVPGTNHIIRKRDLANFCRSNDMSNPDIKDIIKEAKTISQAQGLILNTFEKLDSLVLPHMRKFCPNIYTVGPLHALHKTRLTVNTTSSQESIFSNSVWKEDRTCMSWLDVHDPKTVVYVSIGSLATMTVEELLELWYGIVNSGKPFLWVRRPGSINGGYNESQVPSELIERTKEIGCIVEWAPQEDVLAHPAIGGFLTHSGWNSIMESIVEGVPMVCWPYSVDQQVNSRFVGEVWKIGVDIKDTCDRVRVEKAVRYIMDSKPNAFIQSANIWANWAKESITKMGSSSIHLSRLIDDILAMSSTRS